MRISHALLVTVAALALTASAHATSYTVTGTLNTGTFTGNFSVDSTGNITGGSFAANGVNFSVFGTGPFAPGETSTYSYAYFQNVPVSQYFDLEIALNNGVYSGTPVFCTTKSLCGGTDANILILPSTFNEVTSATVTPVPTPEPSSLALLGTGVLSLAGAVRRRFRS